MIVARKAKVLVVTPHSADLISLDSSLRPEHEVLTAASCREGMVKVLEERPDLILLAADLPKMSGLEMLGRLKETEATRETPVIILAGRHNAGQEEAGLKLGAADYLVKPYGEALLKSRVRFHLRLVRQARLIERVGQIDALTGLTNRLGFQERLDLEWGRARRERLTISLILMEVDDFQAYAAKYGLPQSEELLKALAAVIQAHLNRPADFAARLDRESFAVGLPSTNLEGAVKMARHIRRGLAGAAIPPVALAQADPAAVSQGVAAEAPAGKALAEELLAAAAEKLRAAKALGGGRTAF